MRALLAGKYPSVDHTHQAFPRGSFRGDLAGTPLKVHGAVLAKAGGWAWFKQALNLMSWSGEGTDLKICWIFCEASGHGECPCFDFTRNAAWRRTSVPNRVSSPRHMKLVNLSHPYLQFQGSP